MISINRDGLRAHPFGDDAIEILEAGLAAIDPATRVAAFLSVVQDELCVGELSFSLAGRRIWILAIGKASVPMANAAGRILGRERIAGGVAVTRTGYGGPTDCVRVIEAGHPLPQGTDGADAVIDIASQVKPDDVVVCLLSGGGSALLACPPMGVRLADVARTTELLLHSGVTIDQMNTVRRHMSRLQGGQLMALLYPATVITLILSDVIGDRLESIASGPTVPDPTSFADACAVLERAMLFDRIPYSIRNHLLSGVALKVSDTPKCGDPIFETAHTFLIGNNQTAVDALAARASERGFEVHSCCEPLTGEARDIGCRLADQAKELRARATTKWALVGGGETTVAVRGEGLGGRNQELALAAALQLEGVTGLSVATLATDGTDGPTSAAGALIDGDTAALARERGIDPADAIDRNDSHCVLAATHDLLWTGPTNTNVADLVLILGAPIA
ncbi:DUF4147 domain-containing protein [Candidatus Bipolaricaulota bacterium]|nr:DUF4147 domain-containing protein [Candidatus Bipolaricaulota bacterium]